jgi:hypothetical protein
MKSEEKPEAIDVETYSKLLRHDLQYLLKFKADSVAAFQEFFEMNPCLLPGPDAQADVAPARQTLITRPNIAGVSGTQPDFMWLSFNANCFCPVLISIDAPAKTIFDSDGTVTSDFLQAKARLEEWSNVLSKTINIKTFYESFDVPPELRKMDFKPVFLMLYGRKAEYSEDTVLRDRRAGLLDKSANQYLMSFDSLGRQIHGTNFITVTVNRGKFVAKCLSPTFRIGAHERHLLMIEGLTDATANMGYATAERKSFLKTRIPFWIEKIKTTRQQDQFIPEALRTLE